MQIHDILSLVNGLGPDGLKSIPLKTLLAFPQARDLLPDSVTLALEQLDVDATIGDIPSDAWIAITLSGATKFASSTPGVLASNPSSTEESGQLIICKSCRKAHWYDNHADVNHG